MSFGGPGGAEGSPQPRRIPQWEVDERARQVLGGGPAAPAPGQPWRGEYRAPLEVSARVPASRGGSGRGSALLVSLLVSVSLSAACYVGLPLLQSMINPAAPVAAPVIPGAPAPALPAPAPPKATAPAPAAPPAAAAVPVAPAPAAGTDHAASHSALKAGDTPTPGREEAAAPLGKPAPLASSSTSYAFIGGGRPGQPFVAYDPCRPIHYVVRPDQAPAGGQQMITEGFAAVSKATGLKFIYDGPTTEGPSANRPLFQPAVYGDKWAPVLVVWTNGQETPEMAGHPSGNGESRVLGLSGSGSVAYGDDPYVYVSGQMKLNAPALAEGAASEGSSFVTSTIEHEAGHLVGLDHVDDPTQLMFPQAGPERRQYAAGDLTGLAKLGRGQCAPDL